MQLAVLAQTADLDTFGRLAAWIGVPGAMMAAVLWSLHLGWFRLGREYTELAKQKAELTAERNYWRDMALDALRLGHRAMDTASRSKGGAGTPPAAAGGAGGAGDEGARRYGP